MNAAGVEKYGPYGKSTFTKVRPKIAVVCQHALRTAVEGFVHKLLYGVPDTGGSPGYFTKGFVGKFQLEGADVEYFETTDPSANSYRKAIDEAIAHSTRGGKTWDLALVQTDEASHGQWGNDNPYLVSKALFLSQQIPIQEFEIETTRNQGRMLAFSLNNIALACYAKLGGTPWLLKAGNSHAHEFVIGIGSATIRSDRMGEGKRIIGITTVFSADGSYRLSNLSRAVPFEDFKTALIDSVRDTITQARSELHIGDDDPVRLVIHTCKRPKDVETTAVQELMAQLGQKNVAFAFLQISERHPYTLVETSQPNGGGSAPSKGAYAAPKGICLQLSNHEALVSVVGASDIHRLDAGLPRPLLLNLHKGSTFTDMRYLSEQVFAFASHSWRGYKTAHTPVTVFYSDLVAKLLGKLSVTTIWQPETMRGPIGQTRWFL